MILICWYSCQDLFEVLRSVACVADEQNPGYMTYIRGFVRLQRRLAKRCITTIFQLKKNNKIRPLRNRNNFKNRLAFLNKLRIILLGF